MSRSRRRSRIAFAVVLVAALAALAVIVTQVVDSSEGEPRVTLVWEGDSQSADAGIPPTADLVVPLLDDVTHARTFAIAGSVLDNLIARAPEVDATLADFPGTRNVLVAWAGSNDLGFGIDAAVVHQKYRDYVTARREAGWTVVVMTAMPRSYFGDIPGYEERRQAFNELVRSDWEEWADLLVDVGGDTDVGRPGSQNDPSLYAPDLTHINEAGREVVAEEVAAAFSRLGID